MVASQAGMGSKSCSTHSALSEINLSRAVILRKFKRIIVVPLAELNFPRDDLQGFRLVDGEGRIHRVPYHRVREVYQDGRGIWHRPEGKGAPVGVRLRRGQEDGRQNYKG